MALEENGTTMLVQPASMNNNGGGIFGNDLSFLILFFLLCGGGWGMGGFGGWGGMGMMGMMGMDYLYPWLNNSQNISNGFRDQQISTSLNGIQNAVTTGFGNVQNSLCAGFAGVNATVNGAQNALAQQMYTNQIADLERSFAAQTANTTGLNTVAMNLQNCCCENRANVADLKYTVATENCADRAAAAENTRDIIDAQTRGTQAILDKLCAIELDTVKSQLAQAQRDNVGLQNQLNMTNLAYSQAQQTDALKSDNAAQTQYIVNRVAPYPQPAIVYGYNTQWVNGGCNPGCACA